MIRTRRGRTGEIHCNLLAGKSASLKRLNGLVGGAVGVGNSDLLPIITALQGNITEQSVEAIVNAANSAMRGGGGVDGAIHRAGGPAVLRDCIQRFPDESSPRMSDLLRRIEST